MQIAGFAGGPFQANTYVVLGEPTDGGSRPALVIDPGKDAFAKVNEILAEAGAELECVVLTHGHIDHTRDCAEFGVPVYIHPDDEIMLNPQYGAPGQFGQLFDVASMKMPDELRHLQAGETMTFAGMDFRLVHAPGHSPGCTLIIAEGEDIAFTGDVIFAGSIGRTDLPLSDPAAMERSLTGPVWDLEDSLNLLPGHGPATTMERERAANPYLREANSSR